MKYFEGLTQEKEIKTRYKDLAKKHHPDLGGEKEAMQEINNQYKEVLTGAYQKAGKSITEVDELLKKDLQALAALNLIIGVEGIDVELCGTWIWVTGDTKGVRSQLKEAKFRWAPKKKAWYWRSPDEKKKFYRGRQTYSLQEIRYAYGSDSLSNDKKRKQVA